MSEQGFGPDDEGVLPTLREYGSHQIQFANPSLELLPTLEISSSTGVTTSLAKTRSLELDWDISVPS